MEVEATSARVAAEVEAASAKFSAEVKAAFAGFPAEIHAASARVLCGVGCSLRKGSLWWSKKHPQKVPVGVKASYAYVAARIMGGKGNGRE